MGRFQELTITSNPMAYPEVANLHGPGKGTNPRAGDVRATYGFELSKPVSGPNRSCASCSSAPSKARMEARTREIRDGNEKSDPSFMVILNSICASPVTFPAVVISPFDWPMM